MEHFSHSWEQTPNEKESDSDDGSATSNICYMVQRDDPLEINSDSELDDNDMPYDDLASFCQKLLKKYDLLKEKRFNFERK